MTSGVDVFSDTDPVGPVLQPETLCLYVNNRARVKLQTRPCRRPPVVRSTDSQQPGGDRRVRIPEFLAYMKRESQADKASEPEKEICFHFLFLNWTSAQVDM